MHGVPDVGIARTCEPTDAFNAAGNGLILAVSNRGLACRTSKEIGLV